MENPAERVYIGLPEELKDKVFWVTRPYRINPLSHIPGGTDVIMEYHNSQVLGYDWVKHPSEYIRAMDVMKECWSTGDDPKALSMHFDVDLFKTKVSEIYIRKYKTENYKTIHYEKIWDSKTSTTTPLEAMDNFLLQEYR